MKRIALYAIAVVMQCGCGREPEVSSPRPVMAITIEKRVGAPVFVGTLQPRTSTQLAFRIGGRVVSREVSPGDIVTRGQVLARLDPSTLAYGLAAAEATVAAEAAVLRNADLQQTRERALFAHAAVPATQVDEADRVQAVAAAEESAARARLARARADRSYATLRADFDGVMTRVDFEVGQVVTPNAPIAELAARRGTDVVIDMPEGEEVVIGDSFEVSPLAQPERTRPGRVRQIGASFDSSTRQKRVWVAIADDPNFSLGATMRASHQTALENVVRLPASAIMERDGETLVWVVDEAQHVVRARPVSIAARSEAGVSVERGLADGDHVVIAGTSSLTDGQRIAGMKGVQP